MAMASSVGPALSLSRAMMWALCQSWGVTFRQSVGFGSPEKNATIFEKNMVKLVGSVAGYTCVVTVEGHSFAEEQHAIYFKGSLVMLQGQFPRCCPKEASSSICMAETGRLMDPMRPWVGVNSIRVLGTQYLGWGYWRCG